MDVLLREAGCIAKLQEPNGNNEDAAHHELRNANRPREADCIQRFLSAFAKNPASIQDQGREFPGWLVQAKGTGEW